MFYFLNKRPTSKKSDDKFQKLCKNDGRQKLNCLNIIIIRNNPPRLAILHVIRLLNDIKRILARYLN